MLQLSLATSLTGVTMLMQHQHCSIATPSNNSMFVEQHNAAADAHTIRK
jgi:hypothetical protein